MKRMDQKLVVNSFVSALADSIGSQNSLVISMSDLCARNLNAAQKKAYDNRWLEANEIRNQGLLVTHTPDFSVLDLATAQTKANGMGWLDLVPAETQYDFIVADLPFGMLKEKVQIGGGELMIRKNWHELFKALRLLDDNGMCLAIIEPPAFSIGEGPKYEAALRSEGYHLNGVFNVPENLYETTHIRPVLVAISKSYTEEIFAAELVDEEQAIKLGRAFTSRAPGSSLGEGLLVRGGAFRGFDRLKAEQQLFRLETQYKEYDSFRLGDVAIEINAVRNGQNHKAMANAIYIPMLGTSLVTHDIEQVSIKHHNLFQVVLSEKCNNEYVSAFFQSELGKLVLSSLSSGVFIPKINKSNLTEAKIALPCIDEQREIALTYSRLSSLSKAIASFQAELALNPRSSVAIKDQLENMLEQVGVLTDADKVMNLSRSGESGTVEFKETFSLDVRKGKKEKYIEHSALKNLVGFLNKEGGTLLIGISDSGEILGIDRDLREFRKSKDTFLLHFKNQIKERIGEQFYPFINQRLVNVMGVDILMIECGKSRIPCFLDKKDFYVRTNPATDKLEGREMVDYVQNHFKA